MLKDFISIDGKKLNKSIQKHVNDIDTPMRQCAHGGL
jgi:hypothetical protein